MAAHRLRTIAFTIGGPIALAELPALCEEILGQLERSGAKVALCDLDEHVVSDAVAVEALARLQLAAKRTGCAIRLRQASPDLEELLAFAGLDEVVPRL